MIFHKPALHVAIMKSGLVYPTVIAGLALVALSAVAAEPDVSISYAQAEVADPVLDGDVDVEALDQSLQDESTEAADPA